MTTQELLEMTTEDKIRELIENSESTCETYAKLKLLEKKLTQAEVLEKDIDTRFLLSSRYLLLNEVIFKYIRELP